MLSCRLAQLSSCCPIGCLSSFMSACLIYLAVWCVCTVSVSGPVWLSVCLSMVRCILHLHESSGRPCERRRERESGRLIFVRTRRRADLNSADERQEGTDIKSLQSLSPLWWGRMQSHDGRRVKPLNWFNILITCLCIFSSVCHSSHMLSITMTIFWNNSWHHKQTPPTPNICSNSLTPDSATGLHLIGWGRCHWGTSTLLPRHALYLWLTHSYAQIKGHWLCVL